MSINIRVNARAAAVHVSERREDDAIDFPLCGAPGNTPAAYRAFRPVEVEDAVTCKRCIKIVAAFEARAAEERVAARDAALEVERDDATCAACHFRPNGHGHFALYCEPCSELPYRQAAPLSEAESLARVTGSVAATVVHERRDEAGVLHTDSIDVYVRPTSERPDVVVVRELYGDEAAQLVLEGWTSDSAINHVEGICDVVHCTHPSHDGSRG